MNLHLNTRAAAALVMLATVANSSISIVSNIAPRTDAATGQILDLHDGNTIRINDNFYWYGAGYGPCTEMATGCASVKVGACGFNLNHTVNLAISTDLVQWTFVGSVLPLENRPAGIMFSPWVAQSAETGLYVLWFNVLPVVNGGGDFDAAYYAVATSADPAGPFTLANPNVTGVQYTRLPDAPAIFVDPATGDGYIAFTHEDTHINHVQQLTRDLLGPLPGGNISAQIGASNNEGILMFSRTTSTAAAAPETGAATATSDSVDRSGVHHDHAIAAPAEAAVTTYYVGFGQCCCFCSEGSNVEIFSAPTPLGPYTSQGSIVLPGTPGNATNPIPTGGWGAQTGAVWYTGVDFVLYGDRWQSAPDRIKAHDFSYMAPLSFFDNGTVQVLPGFQGNVTIIF